jgi:chromosome segregation ATPase
MKAPVLSISLLLIVFSSALHAADTPNPAEAKLRESVRALTLQLRTAENEKATLQAAQSDLEARAAAATDEAEKLKKQIVADKNAADLAAADANARIAEKDAIILQRDKDLAQWKKAHTEVTAQFKKAVEIANAKETERAKLAARVIVLDRQVADQQVKNAAMYKLGTEILSRYEKFGLGDVITRKEPFIGTTKVKFENLIQDYSDALADQKIKP